MRNKTTKLSFGLRSLLEMRTADKVLVKLVYAVFEARFNGATVRV